MLLTRVIPCLLLKDGGLVKSVKFKDHKYVGNAINAVRIFNEKEVDELVFLDIDASKKGRQPDFELIEKIATECFMPFGYGGGIKTMDHVKKLFQLGAEKVIMNSVALENPPLITEASAIYGSQSIVVSIDVKKNMWGKYEVYNHVSNHTVKTSLKEYITNVEKLGAGEIIINSVDKDGTMTGYDLKLTQMVSTEVSIPVVALGGAGTLDHLREAVKEAHASAVSAGSMFVFHGKYKAVLITYPSITELESYLK